MPEIGETYHGKIKSIVPFGAFVEIMPGKEALLHISEIDWKRFETMEGERPERGRDDRRETHRRRREDRQAETLAPRASSEARRICRA